MDISERMIKRVEEAHRKAKIAEDSFDLASEFINMKASSSIDIFSDRAASRVVDIAADSRKAVLDLYATYQTEVKLLDEEFRPYLDQGASVTAVKEVLECIKHMNAESEISTNFSGSFNGTSLGNFASGKMSPTVESLMIEKYWEQRYSEMPGASEENKAFAERRHKKRLAEIEAEKKARLALIEQQKQERERERKEKELAAKKRDTEELTLVEKVERLRKIAVYAADHIHTEGGGFNSVAVIVDMDGNPKLIGDSRLDRLKQVISSWKNIKKIVASRDTYIGLGKDGTVRAVTLNSYDKAAGVNGLTGIAEVAVGDGFSVALTNSGGVIATAGRHVNSTVVGPYSWIGVKHIWCGGGNLLIAEKTDGTFLTVQYNQYGRSDGAPSISFREPLQIAVNDDSGAALLNDGKVVTMGNAMTVDNINEKAGIIHISVYGRRVIAVYHDGTVRVSSKGKDDYGARKVTSFINNYKLDGKVLAVSSCTNHILFLTFYGEVYSYSDLTLSGVKGKLEGIQMFKDPGELYDRMTDPEKYERLAREREEKLLAERRQAGLYTYCGGEFRKSIFSYICTRCGRKKNYR